MRQANLALAMVSALLFADSAVAQEFSSQSPSQSAGSNAAASEENDPIVCRTEVVRSTSRIQRRGDRRCMRRSEWAQRDEANRDSRIQSRAARQDEAL